MGVYTISKSILENIKEDKSCATDILFLFTNQRTFNHKVAIDTQDRILNLYRDVAKNDNTIATWLDLMSYNKTSNFEKIKVDLSNIKNEEDIFLKTCSETKNSKTLIIFCHQEWKDHQYSNESNIIEYNGQKIKILDKDDAIHELNNITQNTYNTYNTNSIIASENSVIKNPEIKQKYG